MEKTNAMRILEQKKVAYTPHQYPHGGDAVEAVQVAALLGVAPEVVFKTLVTRGASRVGFVFVIPALAELELKKAAKVVGEKFVELLPVKELTPLTGYVRGGCSPIGMKKRLRTVIDSSALEQSAILVSAGRIGYQVELSPETLAQAAGAEFAPVIKSAESPSMDD